MQHKSIFIVVAAIVAAVVVAGIGYYSGRSAALSSTAQSASGKVSGDASTISAKGKADAAAAAKAAAAHATENKMLNSAVSNPSATSPLPAKGTPLKQELADLKARADAGDAAAASRLFQDMQTCEQVQRLNQSLSAMTNRVLNSTAATPATADAAQRSDRMLDMAQRNIDFANNNAAMCAGLTPDDMAGLVPATLQAAQLRDPQASDCYVGANLNNWPGVLNNPQWISDYQSNAMNLATSGIQQGDWAMVNMMSNAYNGSTRSNNMLSQVTGTNPAQAYTLAKLMNLGQPSANANPTRASNYLNNLASQLTPDQVAAADAQAQNMYQQYFNATPRQQGQVNNTMRACQGGPPPQ